MSALRGLQRRTIVLGLILGLLPAGRALGQGRPEKETSKLHVLMVIDTLDPAVGKSAGVDRDNLTRLLENGFADKRRDRLNITVLQGKDATEKAIVDYYRNLKPGRDDALLFYFSGHGVHDPRSLGHMLALPDRGRIFRTDVRQLMLGKGARLCVLLTDACASFPFGVEVRPVKEGPEWDTLHCLFFAPRGLVDLNGVTEGEVAWGNAGIGGFFTYTLTQTLRRPFKELDADGDGFVHWHEIVPELQLGAQKIYTPLRERALDGKLRFSPADMQRIRTQRFHSVRVFALPPLWRFGARVLDNRGTGVKVALVHNDTPAAVAGLKAGDILLRLGGTALKSADDFRRAVDAARGTVEVEVQRVGSDAIETLRVPLAPWPAAGKDG
jgi:hypothetical protein